MVGRDTRTPERIVKAFWCRGGENPFAEWNQPALISTQ